MYGLHNLAYDEDWKLHSPGKQLLVHNLAVSHAAGRSVDFLPGHLDYKQRFATRTEPVRELHWFRRSARGFLARKLILLNMRIRRRLMAKAKGRAYAAFHQNLDEYLGAFPVDSKE
jgi:CelD/BcsL family acetyltransferase involved in cellulose biosynthesis